MLTNPYYKGQVGFRGVTYDGIHEALVSSEVWYRVQAILGDHHPSGEKTQAHDHYLKGSIFCGAGGSRLILSNARSSSKDVIYPLLLVLRPTHQAHRLPTQGQVRSDIEAAVEDYYRTIQIAPHVVNALRDLIGNHFDQLHDIARRERQAYQAERDDLAQERIKLLQAHYAGAVPIDLLKTEEDRIARRLGFLDARIDAGDIEYDRAKAHLDDCLALAGECHALYLSMDDSLRRTANQAFFDKLYVTADDQIDGQPGEPFIVLFNPDVQRLALRPEAEDESGTQPSSVVGLNDEHWVEVAGIEPASLSGEPDILRAQPTRRSTRLPSSRRHVMDKPSPMRCPAQPLGQGLSGQPSK